MSDSYRQKKAPASDALLLLTIFSASTFLSLALESTVILTSGGNVLQGLSAIGAGPWLYSMVSVFALTIFFWAVFGRISAALLADLMSLAALAFAQAKKHAALGRDVTLNDLSLVGDLSSVMGSVVKSSPLAFSLLALGLLACAACIIWTLRQTPKWPLTIPARIGVIAMMAAFLAAEAHFSFLELTRTSKANTFQGPKIRAFDGFLVSLLKSRTTVFSAPHGYSREAVERLLPSAPPKDSHWAGGERPDVIVYLGESFMDFSTLKKTSFSQDPTPTFHQVQASYDAIHGIHVSPEIAGITANVEFEVLSGIPVAVLPPGTVPFHGLLNRPVGALPRLFRDIGYSTLAFHNYTRENYSRPSAYPLLGFDEFLDICRLPAAPLDGRAVSIGGSRGCPVLRDGQYPSDEMLVGGIIRELDDREAKGETAKPLFAYAVGMVTHGGYPKWSGDGRHQILATVDGEEDAELSNLASPFHSADAALAHLVRKVRERSRPTVLLFFGDHLPFTDVKRLLRGGLERGEFDHGLYEMPWFILSNRPLPKIEIPAQVSSFYLPTILLDALGIGDNGYFGALSGFMGALPCLRTGLGCDVDGGWNVGEGDASLDSASKEAIQSLRMLAYDRLKGERHSDGQ